MGQYLLSVFLFPLISSSQEDAFFSVPQPSSYQQVTCVPIIENYSACYGPGWSENVERVREKYDFYEISIKRRNTNGNYSVIVSSRFDIAEIKESARNRSATDIVEIVPSEDKILFHISDDPVVYEYSIVTDDYNNMKKITNLHDREEIAIASRLGKKMFQYRELFEACISQGNTPEVCDCNNRDYHLLTRQ